ncbi:MAG TPA: bifunctional ([pyruvate, phosphate dikinase] phosphate) phosphotransferase/[pyruvate, phosphate dikinase] kinase [Bdellovibrionales bacterium]|nr:bifunctional ([pyruvate, phosphate dikinase] phosphate) phosphotransferase/[pyruvate, phosphate dikinase] kinase [Pseudobdellovibrionaceae bacterium]HAG91196.1 bifunctional ([pyruvate, phosphate dikinase] phosphate) phosphotransferase/[pyruvate, phosphate dikinase] kinase [Bdellovibrionales bacterium]|tara:strand:+ start:506 stop:1348 length:843 start_codon:yes stop_codon:yes gene_type:complete
MGLSPYFVYILSDGTGETASTMVRAALVQYGEKDIQIVRSKNIRTEDQIRSLMEDVFQRKGMVVYTMVSPHMRRVVFESASEKGIPVVDLMGPLLNAMDQFFDVENSEHEAGLLRAVDERYFKRIEAIEYTVRHDDGKTVNDLAQADIVLVGISRTSKTPLSIFLSHKGWKVANVPLVLNSPIPEELYKIDQRRIVGLTIDPDSLKRIRKRRLEKFGQDPGGEYATLDHIQKELDYSKEVFKKNRRWPVFNVTDRALEETAAEIIRVVASRLDIPYTDTL